MYGVKVNLKYDIQLNIVENFSASIAVNNLCLQYKTELLLK
jgi:hypothetical protein